jgi:hypothetical protein
MWGQPRWAAARATRATSATFADKNRIMLREGSAGMRMPTGQVTTIK